jgi:hypothetical protein
MMIKVDPYKFVVLISVVSFVLLSSSCSRPNGSGINRGGPAEPEQSLPAEPEQIVSVSPEDPLGQYLVERDPELIFDDFLRRILEEAEIPPDFARRVSSLAAEGPAFILDLLAAMEGDPYLWRLADKQHPPATGL